MKKAIAQILLDEGYIKNFDYQRRHSGRDQRRLKYVQGKEKVITGLRRVSKPGLRVYASADEMPQVLRGLGIAIVSTSKGVMTDKKRARLMSAAKCWRSSGKEGSRKCLELVELLSPFPPAWTVKVDEDNNVVTVKGPKGTLTQQFNPNMTIAMEGGELHRHPSQRPRRTAPFTVCPAPAAQHGRGRDQGLQKDLDVKGVGYRVARRAASWS